MQKAALSLLSFLLFAAPAAASSPEVIPDAKLSVTVQKKAEGKIVKGYLVLELSCLNGSCTLSTVTLNECGEVGGGRQGFYPKVQYSSTSIGNLKAKNEGRTIVVQETGSDMMGTYVNNLRFDYEPAKEERNVTRLTGFSGNYEKDYAAAGRVFKLEYIPLPKASQVTNMDCGAFLPGINK